MKLFRSCFTCLLLFVGVVFALATPLRPMAFSQAMTGLPSQIPATVGPPTGPCDLTVVNPGTAILSDDTNVASGLNSIWKCAWDPVTVTYHWFAPFTQTQVNSDWNATTGVAQIFNKPTIPAAQVSSDWNSVTSPTNILNKPTLATVATTGAYADLTGKPTIPTQTSQLTNNSGYLVAPVANASLANPSTTVNGQTCTLGSSCTITVGTGTVTSVATPSASWPAWLIPTTTNGTTAASIAVAASAIPNSALANSSTTPNGVPCTLGSTCTVYPPLICSVTITGNTLVGLLASVQTTTTTSCAGIVSGGSYSVVPSGAPTSGFGILSGAYGSSAGTLAYFLYQPSVALATAYSIPVKIYRLS